MDIREAIIHARQVAEGCGVDSRDCAYQHDCLAEWLEELQAYRVKIPFNRLDEVAALVKARNEGRVVVLAAKTVFEPVWDAGSACDLKCPERFDGLDTCEGCSKAVPYAHQRACRADDVIGETAFLTRAEAEAVLGGGGDGCTDAH